MLHQAYDRVAGLSCRVTFEELLTEEQLEARCPDTVDGICYSGARGTAGLGFRVNSKQPPSLLDHGTHVPDFANHKP